MTMECIVTPGCDCQQRHAEAVHAASIRGLPDREAPLPPPPVGYDAAECRNAVWNQLCTPCQCVRTDCRNRRPVELRDSRRRIGDDYEGDTAVLAQPVDDKHIGVADPEYHKHQRASTLAEFWHRHPEGHHTDDPITRFFADAGKDGDRSG